MPRPEPFSQQPLHEEVLEGINAEGYWGYEHNEYRREEWEIEILAADTLQSYHQWVSSAINREEHGE